MIWNEGLNPKMVAEYFRDDEKGFWAWFGKIIWG